jgi:hypothetical protein
MAVTHSKEMLMESLANIGGQNEIILIFFVCIVYAKSFSCRISESCNHVVSYDFDSSTPFIFFYSEWILRRINNPIVIINSLILHSAECVVILESCIIDSQ